MKVEAEEEGEGGAADDGEKTGETGEETPAEEIADEENAPPEDSDDDDDDDDDIKVTIGDIKTQTSYE